MSATSTSAPPVNHITNNLKTATDLKNDANQLFQQQQYKQAISKYTRAYAYFTGLTTTGEANSMSQIMGRQQAQPTTEQLQQINELQISVGNNVSLCYYKLQDAVHAIKFANKVLTVDKSNTKALYRRALGYMLKSDYGSAVEDLEQAQKLYKQQNNEQIDTAIQNAMKQCKEHVKLSDKKLAEKFKNVDFS